VEAGCDYQQPCTPCLSTNASGLLLLLLLLVVVVVV
jgi:hypothetical protein